MTPLGIAGLAVLSAIALAAIWQDVRYRRLPNWLCLVAAVAGLAFAAGTGGLGLVGSTFLHGCLALLVGMGLFALGGIGGGDAKFYAACATWFPIVQALYLLISVALSGVVVVLLLWFPLRRRRTAGKPDSETFGKVPYGVAIALGALVAKVMQVI